MAIWEHVFPVYFTDLKRGVVERLMRLGEHVPAGVELGYRLCYGDYGHRHFKQPAHATNLVEVANSVIDAVARPINWIHLPVPRYRNDAAYFAPLRGLKQPPGTELYLGLVHFTDGLAARAGVSPWRRTQSSISVSRRSADSDAVRPRNDRGPLLAPRRNRGFFVLALRPPTAPLRLKKAGLSKNRWVGEDQRRTARPSLGT